MYGPESSGKNTLIFHAISEVSKKRRQCFFVDAEHTLDPVYAKTIGRSKS
ncbi:hypothetical protein [Candidatus Phytoplasma tritici]